MDKRAPELVDEEDASETQVEIKYSAAEETRGSNILFMTVVPNVTDLLDMLAFLDRGNIGNAVLAGMSKDLDLEGDRYEWLLTIFYITYIVFEFSLLFWKIFPPHIVGAIVVLGW
ncbi:uncharacterized protein KY384_007422 [Bacidia gigantensis]|uniref:uncharacterized protein n=1 Tax=Bacidia gigantensis TaxID=2732470 RepID=UPI001D049801|nr:uncharacterized protein KY384_007422 [Bacidia gigantensis]KAG8528504.1 hypothetical protein KY384_007422 [Bacidia gigantensis]